MIHHGETEIAPIFRTDSSVLIQKELSLMPMGCRGVFEFKRSFPTWVSLFIDVMFPVLQRVVLPSDFKNRDGGRVDE